MAMRPCAGRLDLGGVGVGLARISVYIKVSPLSEAALAAP